MMENFLSRVLTRYRSAVQEQQAFEAEQKTKDEAEKEKEKTAERDRINSLVEKYGDLIWEASNNGYCLIHVIISNDPIYEIVKQEFLDMGFMASINTLDSGDDWGDVISTTWLNIRWDNIGTK